jgi:hypothetical protein
MYEDLDMSAFERSFLLMFWTPRADNEMRPFLLGMAYLSWAEIT